MAVTLLDISKVVMQRTLDVILTTNFKSAHGEGGERREEREMRTRYVKSCGTSQNEAAEHPSFRGPRVVRVRKEESFNGITERKSRQSRAQNKGRNSRECDALFFQRAIRWMDGWMDGSIDHTIRCSLQKSGASKARENDETAKIHRNNHKVF